MIKAQDKKVPAHKVVLAAHSAPLEAMLQVGCVDLLLPSILATTLRN